MHRGECLCPYGHNRQHEASPARSHGNRPGRARLSRLRLQFRCGPAPLGAPPAVALLGVRGGLGTAYRAPPGIMSCPKCGSTRTLPPSAYDASGPWRCLDCGHLWHEASRRHIANPSPEDRRPA